MIATEQDRITHHDPITPVTFHPRHSIEVWGRYRLDLATTAEGIICAAPEVGTELDQEQHSEIVYLATDDDDMFLGTLDTPDYRGITLVPEDDGGVDDATRERVRVALQEAGYEVR